MKLGLVASSSFALLMFCAAGCTSSDNAGNGPGPIAFAPAAPAEGPSVFLRSEPTNVLLPDRLVVDVVARGAADLHGAAFRLSWDAATLGFVEAKSGAPWSKQALAMAKEGSPGELAVVWAEKGEASIDANGETVLGTIAFDVHGRKGSALGFKTERSQLVDKKGIRVETTWTGGQLAPR